VKQLLKQKCGVRVLLRAQSPNPFPGLKAVEVVRGDITDFASVGELVRNVSAVFHTAALVVPWVKNPAIQYKINVGGTQCVLRIAAASQIPVVCTNSIAALAPYPPPVSIRWLDGNHYVKSKRTCLRLVQKARSRGVQAYSVIPSGIVGPEDCRPTAIGHLVSDISQNHGRLICFNGGLYLVDVSDVAEAHWRALGQEPADYVLPGEYWSLDRLFTAIGHAAGKETRLLRVPYLTTLLGSKLLSIWSSVWTNKPPVITPAWVHYFRQAISMKYQDDSGRLGIKQTPVSQSIENTVAWFSRQCCRGIGTL